MVTRYEIECQLRAINVNFNWWGRAEFRELEAVIEPGETIMYCINGYYQNGFAMLCITDQRAVLIDKKPLYLTLEDINYNMISEVDYDGRLFDSTIIVRTLSKNLKFTCLGKANLRKATAYLQRRILEFKRQSMLAHQVHKGASSKEVNSFEHKVTSPYVKASLVLRRKMSGLI